MLQVRDPRDDTEDQVGAGVRGREGRRGGGRSEASETEQRYNPPGTNTAAQHR